MTRYAMRKEKQHWSMYAVHEGAQGGETLLQLLTNKRLLHAWI